MKEFPFPEKKKHCYQQHLTVKDRSKNFVSRSNANQLRSQVLSPSKEERPWELS